MRHVLNTCEISYGAQVVFMNELNKKYHDSTERLILHCLIPVDIIPSYALVYHNTNIHNAILDFDQY